MLGDLWLGQAERFHHVVHRLLAADEQIEDLPPALFGDGVEGIGVEVGSGVDEAS